MAGLFPHDVPSLFPQLIFQQMFISRKFTWLAVIFNFFMVLAMDLGVLYILGKHHGLAVSLAQKLWNAAWLRAVCLPDVQ